VRAYQPNGTTQAFEQNTGWTTARSISASSTGTVKLRVTQQTAAGSTAYGGTFALAYNTANTRPTP